MPGASVFRGVCVFFIGQPKYICQPRILPSSLNATKHTEEQADALHEQRIHVGIGRQAQAVARCSSLLLLRERVMIALEPDHPLAKKETVHIAQLAQSLLVLYPKHPNSQFSRFVESLYQDAGIAPPVVHRAYE